MSKTDDRRHKTERLDIAIDRAVREMLDVEPPAGLRGRVMEQIEHPRRSGFTWMWIAAPVATAAVIMLAVLLPGRRTQETPAPQPITRVDYLAPPSAGRLPSGTAADRGVHTTTRTQPAARQVERAALAAVAGEEESAPFQLAALEGPASIAVEKLAGPPAPSVGTIDIAPIRIPALEVNALPETPRERQQQE